MDFECPRSPGILGFFSPTRPDPRGDPRGSGCRGFPRGSPKFHSCAPPNDLTNGNRCMLRGIWKENFQCTDFTIFQMADRDGDYISDDNELVQTPQQTKKSKVHVHSSIVRNEATGTLKLKCNYCTKSYAYSGGNTNSMLQHFRITHRQLPAIVADFPLETPKSDAQLKRDLAASSIVENIERMKPMAPENRVARKITDCLSDYCSLNNRTLDMVNDVGLVRLLAAANPRYQLYSRTYMTKTKLPERYAAAVRSIREVLDAQPGGWFTSDLWSTDNSPDEFLALNFHCFDDNFVYWKFTLGPQTFDDRKTAEEIFSQWILCFIEWGFLSAIANVPEFHDHNGKRVRNVNA